MPCGGVDVFLDKADGVLYKDGSKSRQVNTGLGRFDRIA
jgi:hypothetical protein